MTKKKKGNGSQPALGNQNGPKPSALVGSMFSNAGVAKGAAPQASAEMLVAQLEADLQPEECAKVEHKAREQIKAEVEMLNAERDELTTLRASLDQEAQALKGRREALEAEAARAQNLASIQAETEARLLERERALDVRELNARSGFNKQNEVALKDLRAEVDALELRKLEIGRELEKDRREARERIQAEVEAQIADAKTRALELDTRQVELDRKAAELKSREGALSIQRGSFEALRRDLEEQVKSEFREEVQRREEEIQRMQRRLNRLNEAHRAERDRLDEYADLAEALGGRDPASLRTELEDLRQENRELKGKLSSQETAESIGELERLQEELDAARQQIRDLRQKLEERKVAAHEQQLVALERQQWSQEKRVLERTKQLLDGHIRDLESRITGLVESQQADVAFPELVKMDRGYQIQRPVDQIDSLKSFTEELQHRIAVADPDNELYFRLEDLQLFVGGLAMSQLHVFQGISGTGKTSLATAFAKAVGGECQDIAVQAGWRDRSDLLGHYNAFEKRFSEKECLQAIYRALTPSASDRLNIVLLDEMNLSRPEQYFADFLSALEKSVGDRWIRLMESAPANAPRLLRDGREILLPQNLWFIGTANQDETTNELADKTHDRAFVLELPRHEDRFSIDRRIPQKTYSFAALNRAFEGARDTHRKEVAEMLGFVSKSKLSDVLDKEFGIGWGNRFERQAKCFLPVVKECGGTFAGALDHLLSTRIFRAGKVVGRYDVSKDQLDKAEEALLSVFQEVSKNDLPVRCVSAIERDRKRMERGT